MNVQRRSKDIRLSVFDVLCLMLAAYLILLTGVASFNSNGLAEEKNDTESIKIGLLLPVGQLGEVTHRSAAAAGGRRLVFANPHRVWLS